jgi:hypothetical protein
MKNKGKYIGFVGSIVILCAAVGNMQLENSGYVLGGSIALVLFTTWIAFFKK